MPPDDATLKDLLWALGGSEPEEAVSPHLRPWRWAAAAALLMLALAGARWLRPDGVPAFRPAAVSAVPRPSGGLQRRIAAAARAVESHPGRGVVLVLCPPGSLEQGWEAGDRLALGNLSGTAWIDLPPGVPAVLTLAEGTLRAEGSAFAVSVPAPRASAGLWPSEAMAGDDAGPRIAVSRGKVTWEPGGGAPRTLGENEVWDPNGARKDPDAVRDFCAGAEAWTRRSWTPLLTDPLRIPGGKGMHPLRSQVSLPPCYEMEARLRCTLPEGGAGLVYEAEGRYPICLSPGGVGWHTLRVLVSDCGVELWVDDRLAQVLPPGEVARAATFETGLSGAGIACWESGLEVERWRWRPLGEVGP